MLDTISSYFAMFLFIALTLLFCVAYQLVIRYWYYFSDRNVKFVRGIPLLGSAYKSVLGIEPAAISYRRCYEHFPKDKFVGVYGFGGQPAYLIRDPDLIKQLLITDIDYFTDHKLSDDHIAHSFGTRRSKWNPAFSCTVLHKLHSSVVKSSAEFIKALKETDKIAKIFDSRELFSRYASDALSLTHFSIEMNSIRDVDNEFFKAGYSLSEICYMDSLKMLASLNFPSLVKFLEIHSSDEKEANYLQKFVKENVEARKEQNVSRNDLIDLMFKARNGQLENNDIEQKECDTTQELNNEIENLTDDDLMTQGLIIFVGGMSSVSGIASFMFHELALNPDIQERLFAEINGIKQELNGSPLTFETIQNMKYLDMVVSESLRRWCPIPFIERTCNRPYVLENADDKVELQAGDGILVPTYALHMDDKYFYKPLKFDPERFSEENKASIRNGTYFPLQIGNGFESRFAVVTIKTLAYHLLSEFYIDKSYKTQDPLKLKSLPFQMDAEKGFYIELRRRHPDRSPYKSQVFI